MIKLDSGDFILFGLAAILLGCFIGMIVYCFIGG